MSDVPRDDVVAAIAASAERVISSATCLEWMESDAPKEGDLVLVNNSFLYRSAQSTVKNDKCIAVIVGADRKSKLPFLVATHKPFITQFKRIPGRRSSTVMTRDVASAVEEEIVKLGSIVFALVGRIGADERAEVTWGVDGWEALAYDPSQKPAVLGADGKVTINRLDDIDAAWTAVKDALGYEEEAADAVAETFESAFQSLQEEAKRPVDLSDIAPGAPSILASVIVRIADQITSYRRTLAVHMEHPEDGEAYNELLRIAYNFADGAAAFLTLVVGLCDLKPVIFWLTVSEQVELSEQFRRLPFSLVGKVKPSLDRYRSVIANARNQVFHDIFGFDRSFRVRLPGDALKSPELHLFREYGRRNDPALDFEDRKLVDVLKGFSRVPVRPVPLGFWDKNLAVMTAVERLAVSVRDALVLLGSVVVHDKVPAR